MLDNLTRSVILAAVAPTDTAKQHWYAAKRQCDVADWPDACARLLPEIYVNIPDEPDVEISGLAKGVYRQCWSRNIRSLTAAARFAIALEIRGMDYRIIKGGAINLIHSKHGIRRMGDIDWVFHKPDGFEVVKILAEIGFRPRYEFPDNRMSEIWDDESGITFDIHFLSRGNPLNVAFDSCQRVSAYQANFRTPSFAAMAMIAAEHATLGHAKSDFAQGLVDVALLASRVDTSELAALIRRYGRAAKLRGFFIALSQLAPDSGLFDESNYPKDNFKSLRFKFYPDLKVRRRLITPVTWTRFKNSKKTRRGVAYGIWLSFGSLRPIEQFWCARFGGFLDDPELGEGFTERLALAAEITTASNLRLKVGRLSENELRFAFRKPKGVAADLHLSAHLENPTPRMLFINGVGHGHFTPRFATDLALPLHPEEERFEISLRDFSQLERPWRGEIEVRLKLVSR